MEQNLPATLAASNPKALISLSADPAHAESAPAIATHT